MTRWSMKPVCLLKRHEWGAAANTQHKPPCLWWCERCWSLIWRKKQMTKRVFNWRSALVLVVFAVVVSNAISMALVHFGIIHENHETIVILTISFGIGWFGPYRAFKTVESN